MITFEVNTVEFDGAMQRLRAGVRAGFIDPQYGTLTVQGRLLSERCQEFTPPRNVAQGRAAVTRDIMRVFRPLSHTTFTDKRIRKIVQKDDRPGWDAAALHFNGTHALKNTQAIGFTQDWHQRNRDRRGRVKGRGNNLGKVTLGPEGRQARSYLNQIKKHVGWAKAGWNMGIYALGGYVRAPWISRHGLNRGRLNDGRMSPDPFVHVINDTGWGKYGGGEAERILRNAISARARDMEAYYFRMMSLAAKKADPAAA